MSRLSFKNTAGHDGLKKNYYALLLAILTKKSVNQALIVMKAAPINNIKIKR